MGCVQREGFMKQPPQRSGTPSRLSHSCFFLLATCLLFSDIASAAPSISLSKRSGPPTSTIRASGHGFEANVGVDIYFGTKDEALVVTNGKGEFDHAKIYAPRNARPYPNLRYTSVDESSTLGSGE